MTYEQFEGLVHEGLSRIPERFLEKRENVAICIEDEPTGEQREALKLRRGATLFGLYEGVSHLEGGRYGRGFPDRITIFRKPIVAAARSNEEIAEIVAETVWHEIAHHFGMDEGEVARAERRRTRRRMSP